MWSGVVWVLVLSYFFHIFGPAYSMGCLSVQSVGWVLENGALGFLMR